MALTSQVRGRRAGSAVCGLRPVGGDRKYPSGRKPCKGLRPPQAPRKRQPLGALPRGAAGDEAGRWRREGSFPAEADRGAAAPLQISIALR